MGKVSRNEKGSLYRWGGRSDFGDNKRAQISERFHAYTGPERADKLS